MPRLIDSYSELELRYLVCRPTIYICTSAEQPSSVRDNWARNTSPNRNIKVYIGAPAASSAAGQGYVDASTLSDIATTMRKSFPSFGGVMLWDASQAYGTLPGSRSRRANYQ